MKNVLLMLALLLSTNVLAGDIDDMFGGGEDEFEFERFRFQLCPKWNSCIKENKFKDNARQ